MRQPNQPVYVKAKVSGMRQARKKETAILLTSHGLPRHNGPYLHASLQCMRNLFGGEFKVWITPYLWVLNDLQESVSNLREKGRALEKSYLDHNEAQLRRVECITEDAFPVEEEVLFEFLQEYNTSDPNDVNSLRGGIHKYTALFVIKHFEENAKSGSADALALKESLPKVLKGLKIVSSDTSLPGLPYFYISIPEIKRLSENLNSSLRLQVERSFNFLFRENFHLGHLMEYDHLFYAGNSDALKVGRNFHVNYLNKKHGTTRYSEKLQLHEIIQEHMPCPDPEKFGDKLALVSEDQKIRSPEKSRRNSPVSFFAVAPQQEPPMLRDTVPLKSSSPPEGTNSQGSPPKDEVDINMRSASFMMTFKGNFQDFVIVVNALAERQISQVEKASARGVSQSNAEILQTSEQGQPDEEDQRPPSPFVH